VPDTAEVKIDPDTNTLVRSGVESISNPYDIVALEAALQMKDAHGGAVTAVSMGPPQAEEVLREALSLGADHVILLSDRSFAGADTLATSYALAKAVEKIHSTTPVDLVWCGKQAIDGDTAQVGPGLATRLAFSQLTYVQNIETLDLAARCITVERRVERAMEIVRSPLPAVITVELELANPRRAPLPLLVRSLRGDIQVWGADQLEADPSQLGLKGSPTWVKRIFSPPVREGGPIFDAEQDTNGAVEQCLSRLLADEAFAAKLTSRWKT
jgi:electron transfer flavoprotein beta subunit